MPITPLLSGRRSVRVFQDRPVPEGDLAAMMEAARWAPSSGNSQPWRFLARQSDAARAELGPCLSRGNQWALRAPLLLTLVTKTAWGTQSNGLEYAVYDCGQAAFALTIEAEARGLRVHQMAGWLKEPLVRLLRLPPDVTPVTVIAVGFEGDTAALDPALREKESRPRTRKPAGEVWALDTWPAAWGID